MFSPNNKTRELNTRTRSPERNLQQTIQYNFSRDSVFPWEQVIWYSDHNFTVLTSYVTQCALLKDKMFRISLFHITTKSELVTCNNIKLNSSTIHTQNNPKLRFPHSELINMSSKSYHTTIQKHNSMHSCIYKWNISFSKFKEGLACKGLCASGFFLMYAILNSKITWIQNGLQDTV